MPKDHGISERELSPELLARIGMGNYFQKQTMSITTSENNQMILPIPMADYKSQVYKFDIVMDDGSIISESKYDINEELKLVTLKAGETGIATGKKVDFIFQWNAYISKNIEVPTVYLSDCNTKVCTIDHNMKKYPHIQVLEVLYGAGIGPAGEYPAGAASKMLYPRLDYVDLDRCDLYLNDEYDKYLNPKLNRVSEGKYIVTFDEPCVKSLLILVDKFELFNSDKRGYIDSPLTAIENPVKGLVNNQIIYGSSLVNLLSYMTMEDRPTYSRIQGIANTNLLKQDIVYTMINLNTKPITLVLFDNANNRIKSIPVGNNPVTFSLTQPELALLSLTVVTGDYSSTWNNSMLEELKTSMILLEGDYSIKNKPTKFFTGIKSVGDDNLNLKAVNDLDDTIDDYSEINNNYDIILRGIGTIRDKLNVNDNTITRNVASATLGYDFLDFASFNTTGKTKTYNILIRKLCDLGDTDGYLDSVCDKLKNVSISDTVNNDIDGIYSIYYVAASKCIEIRINVLQTEISNLYSFGITDYLKSKNINILYSLKTPTIEKVSCLPMVFNDDTKYVVLDTYVVPEVEFYYPLNIKSTVDNLVTSINNLRNEIQKLSKNDNELLKLKDTVMSSVNFSTKLLFGMNNVIKNDSNVSSPLKIGMTGNSVTNLLNKDGDCEDITKMTANGSTISLDNTTKVFGSNSIKVISTNTIGSAFITPTVNIDSSKYYCVSAYMKNFNCDSMQIMVVDTDGAHTGLAGSNADTEKTTGFKRVFLKFSTSLSQFVGKTQISIYPRFAPSAIGQYGNVDGIMFEEITAAQYNDNNFQPSPYVDSYACLQNPYVEVRHHNLVKNGNGEKGLDFWILPYTTCNIALVSGKFKVSGIDAGNDVRQLVPVKKNTNYYITGNVTKGTINGSISVAGTNNIGITSVNGVFNSGDNDKVWIRLRPACEEGAGYALFDSIMLIEGTTAPSGYRSCKIEKLMIEGQFSKDDYFNYENGKISGLLNSKHKTILGKDFDWLFSTDLTGAKRIELLLNHTGIGGANGGMRCIKYDGKSLITEVACITPDSAYLNSTGISLSLSIADSETGWLETVNPNNNEVKCFMNGWKALNNDGTRYTSWISILANPSTLKTDVTAYPPNTATTLTVATTNTTSITVANGALFVVGDRIGVYGNPTSYIITAISGNVITVGTAVPAQPIGTVVYKIDTTGSDTRILSYCSSFVAQGYEGYKIHYKLLTPEPINTSNVKVYGGDVPVIDSGDNYVNIDSGIILNERVYPMLDIGTGSDSYVFNTTYPTYYNPMRNKAEAVTNVYRNAAWEYWNREVSSYSYGKEDPWIAVDKFDNTAIYTAEYKILATMAPQIASDLSFSYAKDMLTALNSLQDSMKNVQLKNSVIDGIMDKSSYEVFPTVLSTDWFHFSSYISIPFVIKMSPKKTVPTLTIDRIRITYFDGTTAKDTSNYIFGYFGRDYGNDNILIRLDIKDTDIINSIKTYGVNAFLYNVRLDCKDRI